MLRSLTRVLLLLASALSLSVQAATPSLELHSARQGAMFDALVSVAASEDLIVFYEGWPEIKMAPGFSFRLLTNPRARRVSIQVYSGDSLTILRNVAAAAGLEFKRSADGRVVHFIEPLLASNEHWALNRELGEWATQPRTLAGAGQLLRQQYGLAVPDTGVFMGWQASQEVVWQGQGGGATVRDLIDHIVAAYGGTDRWYCAETYGDSIDPFHPAETLPRQGVIPWIAASGGNSHISSDGFIYGTWNGRRRIIGSPASEE